MSWSNPLKARWRAGEATFGLWCTSANPAASEYVAHSSVDWILWDQQHGLVTDADLHGLFRTVLGTKVVPLVRVAANDLTLIGRALDAGAAGVIVPLVNTAEEAAAAAAACRYMPHGERSFGPNRITLVVGGLDPRVVEDVACVVMIETAAGIENAEAIAATPGVDCVLIGPGDLALGLGLEWNDRGPIHQAAVKRILDAATAAGKPAGIVLGSGEAARRYAEMGFRFMNVGSDLPILVDGLERELKTARGG
ncbi:MAG: aldolase [Chloroflexi bacterium]|nr:aldolase [Chloroflexota bacterium]